MPFTCCGLPHCNRCPHIQPVRPVNAKGFHSEMEIKTRAGSVWNCSVTLGGRLPASLCCDTLPSAEKAHELGATLGWMGWTLACWTPSRRSMLTGQTGQQQGDWRWRPGQGEAVSRADLDGHLIWNPVWLLDANSSDSWRLSSHFLAKHTPSPPAPVTFWPVSMLSVWHQSSCWDSPQAAAELLNYWAGKF